MKHYNVIINGKNVFDQPNDSDIKWYEETREIWTGQDEDYTPWCSLDYDYIKNHYRLIAIDFSRQKELNGDTLAIMQIGIVQQLKNVDGNNTDGAEPVFVLTILE